MEADTRANERAVDSLLNYETVKYFGNEEHEARRYDASLVHLENANVMARKTLAVLNLGQSAIIAIGVTTMMWRAAAGVVAGTMTIGDLVLVNAYLLQLFSQGRIQARKAFVRHGVDKPSPLGGAPVVVGGGIPGVTVAGDDILVRNHLEPRLCSLRF